MSLIGRSVEQALAWPEVQSPDVAAKATLCLADALRCMFEARDLPTSRQARALIHPSTDGVPVAAADLRAGPAEAAFAMATMSASLLREDMHAASISHHGIVVWPTLLTLSHGAEVSGARLLAAGVVGYEFGARLGAALFDADLARRLRPTAFSATAGAAMGGAWMLGLSEVEAAAAVALAVDASSGLNQWPHSGGDEIFFQAGRAAQAAVQAVTLARAGAFASPPLLDGPAGLFAAAGRTAPDDLGLFAADPQILAVYNKALPICNFAQTAAQAALDIARRPGFSPDAVEALTVAVTEAAKAYPGCDHAGPCERPLQAKMSIQFSVAAALAHGDLPERRFHVLDDPVVARLSALCTLRTDPALTAAFPARQGARVEVRLAGGESLTAALTEVAPATPEQIRQGLLASAGEALGAERADALLHLIDRLEGAPDAAVLLAAAHIRPPQSAAAPHPRRVSR
ncbi:MAG: MmgE/PrpD family protein [Caulobacteraceae bacterium]